MASYEAYVHVWKNTSILVLKHSNSLFSVFGIVIIRITLEKNISVDHSGLTCYNDIDHSGPSIYMEVIHYYRNV